ncbi:hypothetical protein [Actinoplanes sichuanensis]|uniref:hypothetical protein n=1 Tax=Actinoplanes sichuanensis TaxID=512349 RepID=UPI00295554B9|nr:hypothetical protein [Actinoplanes sichuanensis]
MMTTQLLGFQWITCPNQHAVVVDHAAVHHFRLKTQRWAADLVNQHRGMNLIFIHQLNQRSDPFHDLSRQGISVNSPEQHQISFSLLVIQGATECYPESA